MIRDMGRKTTAYVLLWSPQKAAVQEIMDRLWAKVHDIAPGTAIDAFSPDPFTEAGLHGFAVHLRDAELARAFDDCVHDLAAVPAVHGLTTIRGFHRMASDRQLRRDLREFYFG